MFMSELLILILSFSVCFSLPFIVSFFIAMFFVKEMPTEKRRPASIKDCFECMFFDGYTDTLYYDYYRFFLMARMPIIGFCMILCFAIVGSIYFLFYGLFKLITYIPGVKWCLNGISNIYSKIINYKFR